MSRPSTSVHELPARQHEDTADRLGRAPQHHQHGHLLRRPFPRPPSGRHSPTQAPMGPQIGEASTGSSQRTGIRARTGGRQMPGAGARRAALPFEILLRHDRANFSVGHVPATLDLTAQVLFVRSPRYRRISVRRNHTRDARMSQLNSTLQYRLSDDERFPGALFARTDEKLQDTRCPTGRSRSPNPPAAAVGTARQALPHSNRVRIRGGTRWPTCPISRASSTR